MTMMIKYFKYTIVSRGRFGVDGGYEVYLPDVSQRIVGPGPGGKFRTQLEARKAIKEHKSNGR